MAYRGSTQLQAIFVKKLPLIVADNGANRVLLLKFFSENHSRGVFAMVLSCEGLQPAAFHSLVLTWLLLVPVNVLQYEVCKIISHCGWLSRQDGRWGV